MAEIQCHVTAVTIIYNTIHTDMYWYYSHDYLFVKENGPYEYLTAQHVNNNTSIIINGYIFFSIIVNIHIIGKVFAAVN